MKEGRLYEPTQVSNGKNCGCVCPACDRPLIAKQGAKTPHFAHAPGEDCAKAVETAVHLAAKQLIEDRMELRLPSLMYHLRQIYTPRLAKLDSVTLEQWIGSIRPDVVAVADGIPVLVEIAVTHYVDEKKEAKIRELGLATIEIDLAKFKTVFTFANLEAMLFSDASNAHWLYHPKRKELDEETLREHLAEVAQKEVEIQRREEQFRKYREMSTEKKLELHLKKLGITREQLKKLSKFVPWENSFSVHREVWQTAVLVFIAHEAEEQGGMDLLPTTVNRDECNEWMSKVFDINPPVVNGEKIATWKYLEYLSSIGILRNLYHGGFDVLVPPVNWKRIH